MSLVSVLIDIAVRVILVSSTLVLTSCTLLRASPAPNSGFLPDPAVVVENRDRAPFNGFWMIEEAEYLALTAHKEAVYIAPINTSYAEKRIRSRAPSDREAERRIEELREVASFMRNSFQLAIQDFPGHPYKIKDQAGPNVLILELAIVDIEATNPITNTIGTAASFFLPGGGLIKLAGKGSIAIEGLVRDGATNKVLEQFKDRESDKAAPFTIKDFQEYAHVRQSIVEWAMQTAELLATPSTHQVDDSLPFGILPT